ncbi:putative reverse transcriptase zinc-binding domain-containing protein [Helianthus annuus]|nr:putative reverse transcriptase zinc-binding domain-containing protein [Helianthus annuus]
MANIIGCQAESFPFRYLGLTVGANMNRVANWRPVYNIIDARLAKWKATMLSMGGRITLIKSVLESLPNYFFSLYKAPVQVIKDIESKIRNFLWGGDNESKKIHWAAWDRVAGPIDKGGLGLSKLNHINISLLIKWGWRFKSEKENLWVRVIEAVHKSNSNLDSFPIRKSLGGVWFNIVNLLDNVLLDNKPIKDLFKGELGNGESIKFWLDSWLPGGPLKHRFPSLFELETKKECRVIERINNSGNSRFSWKWRRVITAGQEVDDLIGLCSLLFNVSLIDVPDKWVWDGSADRLFSVSSIKASLSNKFNPQWNYVPSLCKWLPRKYNVFIWRLGVNKLATMDALKSRNIDRGDQTCVLCGECDETAEHLFSSCSFSSTVWALISLWCKIPCIWAFSVKDLLESHEFAGISGRKKDIIQGVIRIGCWVIWKSRNEARFNNKPVKMEEVIREIKSFGFFWFNARSKDIEINWLDWCNFVNM